VNEEDTWAFFAMVDQRTNFDQVLRKRAEDLYRFLVIVFLATTNISHTNAFYA
jgi:hypothetical protein